MSYIARNVVGGSVKVIGEFCQNYNNFLVAKKYFLLFNRNNIVRFDFISGQSGYQTIYTPLT